MSTAPGETLERPTMTAPPGAIVLARHGRPIGDRGVMLDWRGYEEWWAEYDRSGLVPEQTPPAKLCEAARNATRIFSSPLPRALETATALAAGRPVTVDPIFVEAPMPPPPVWGKRNPREWGVWARAAWWLGRAAGQESRKQAEQRAEAAVATLTARALRGETVVLCAHGWFNRMMRPVLKRQGWVEVEDGGDAYWSYRRFEKKR